MSSAGPPSTVTISLGVVEVVSPSPFILIFNGWTSVPRVCNFGAVEVVSPSPVILVSSAGLRLP